MMGSGMPRPPAVNRASLLRGAGVTPSGPPPSMGTPAPRVNPIASGPPPIDYNQGAQPISTPMPVLRAEAPADPNASLRAAALRWRR